jgi:periplasmic protein TonB
MFDTLLASPTAGTRWIRPITIALALHGLVIVVAIGRTTSPPVGTRPVARDTIRLEMIEVKPSRPKNAEAQPSRPKPPIPAPPSVPDIPLNAPEYQLPALSLNPPGMAEPRRTSLHREFGQSTVPLDSAPSVFSTADVDELPELAEELRPRYPDALRSSRMSGLVQVQYVIERDGTVDQRSVRVLTTSHSAFSQSALAALRHARFKPARRGGRPAAVLVQQTIRFLYR